jgi:hypothetical protein
VSDAGPIDLSGMPPPDDNGLNWGKIWNNLKDVYKTVAIPGQLYTLYQMSQLDDEGKRSVAGALRDSPGQVLGGFGRRLKGLWDSITHPIDTGKAILRDQLSYYDDPVGYWKQKIEGGLRDFQDDPQDVATGVAFDALAAAATMKAQSLVAGRLGGPYADIADPPSANSGKKFSRLQKAKIREANKAKNGGVLKDDKTGEILAEPMKHKKGVSPPPNEANIDHVFPRSRGGPNCYSNAEVRSRLGNIKKSDSLP